MNSAPKYALPEIERRFRVEPSRLPALDTLPRAQITDRYLHGTRLRLRRASADGIVTYKLCKKYEPAPGEFGYITNLYLSEDEWQALNGMTGVVVTKARYQLPEGGAIDQYDPPLDLLLYSVEFDTIEAASTFDPPPFVADEVSDDPQFSGYALAVAGGRSG
jgi:CYTH domain-containing protein